MTSWIRVAGAPLVLALAGSVHVAAAPRPAADAAAFAAEADRWVPDALRRLDAVPSLALAVVVGDEVVLARAYGQADVEQGLPATDATLYYIASATKPFTALAAAILDARGAIDLDDSLAKHLHGVTLDPALRAPEVRLRDLLTHTSGIDNDPIAFRLAYSGEHDPETLWKLLAKSAPMEGAPLGKFRYTNVGYNILGMILDRETGRPWQDVLRDEIFTPLGMEHTTAYASLPTKHGWPLAAPYFGVQPQGRQRIDLVKTDATMQSAGGMLSSARDLGRWLELQINAGMQDGVQRVDAAVVRATHEARVECGDGRPPFGQTAYGLGWSHGAWRGERVLHHGGSFPGFVASLSFMPEARIGVAVLVNEGSIGHPLADLVAVWAYDWWLGVAAAERAAPGLLEEAVAARDQLAQRVAADRERRAGRSWTLSRPTPEYAGRYVSELYGTIEVAARDGRIEVRQGNLHSVAEPFTEPEKIRVELVPGTGRVLAFEPAAGVVARLRLQDGVYERVR